MLKVISNADIATEFEEDKAVALVFKHWGTGHLHRKLKKIAKMEYLILKHHLADESKARWSNSPARELLHTIVQQFIRLDLNIYLLHLALSGTSDPRALAFPAPALVITPHSEGQIHIEANFVNEQNRFHTACSQPTLFVDGLVGFLVVKRCNEKPYQLGTNSQHKMIDHWGAVRNRGLGEIAIELWNDEKEFVGPARLYEQDDFEDLSKGDVTYILRNVELSELLIPPTKGYTVALYTGIIMPHYLVTNIHVC